MGRKRKHSETVTAAPVKDSAPERPQRTLLGWKDKKEDAENSKPAYASVFRNKEKVLVTCSRRINFR
jgi:ribosome biogenesis protein BRX1